MKRIDIQQNTPEWLQWRRGGIGGSDANLIAAFFLPDSYDFPYGNTWPGAAIFRLWCEKTGRIQVKPHRDQSDGDYIDPLVHGQKEEPKARDLYMAITGNFVQPACVEHDILPHLRASLDGLGDNRILEVKCPKEGARHQEVKETGRVPDRYFPQVIHNLITAQVDVCDFVSYFQDDLVVVPVQYGLERGDAIREAEEEFWTWVTEDKFGGLPINGEVTNVTKEWEVMLDEYFRCQQQLREVEGTMRRLRAKIARSMKASRTIGAGARATIAIRPSAEIPAYVRSEFLSLNIERTT